MSNSILHAKIQRTFNDLLKLEQIPYEIPYYIKENLGHYLRPYQEEALLHLIYTQQSSSANISYNHLLFHMATGSGKTLVMAASLLYLFREQGHQNFIFFANSDAIVKKTTDNFINSMSSKYLFNKNGIIIDGQNVQIQIVDNFPATPSPLTIYLKLTSIQKLHTDLNDPKENSLTYEGLSNLDIVLLADEAHHYFAETKRDKKKVSTKESEIRSWEITLDKILNLNPLNRLLGFSATFNLTNELLFEKLSNKIVYQYDLENFMNSGYSKNVVLLQSNEEDDNKMINAILLSQFRKYIAKENEIDLKPIILFKSNRVATSISSKEKFIQIIENLSVHKIEKIIAKGLLVYKKSNTIWEKMFLYYSSLSDLSLLVKDLQWEFEEKSIIDANDQKFMSEGNALLLNTLEERDNPIRTIFAVAKLNEGWDVLNLYDIVRISEGSSSTKNTTDSEAQLIGRGARYYPFVYKSKIQYQRRFDDVSNDLKLIETLHYHTINDNAYIKNLNKSLEEAHIQVKEDGLERLTAKIKSNFKKTDLYKNGKVYINQVIPTTKEDYESLSSYNVSTVFEKEYDTGIEKQYGNTHALEKEVVKHEDQLIVSSTLFKKAMQRIPFYHFNNLKLYIPAIQSSKEFVESQNFLAGIKFYLKLPRGFSANDLSPKEKLGIVEDFLIKTSEKIRLNYLKTKGTPVFESVQFNKIFDDYFIEINKISSIKNNMSEIRRNRNMNKYDWYIYDQAIGNDWEFGLIDFIHDYIEELKTKYNEVFLIRNEKKYKVTEFHGTRRFMPDFLLYLKDENCTYHVFIEPKGSHLQKQDEWKEEFMSSLSNNPDIEILSENDEVRLLGLKFYSKDLDKKQEFREDFHNKLL